MYCLSQYLILEIFVYTWGDQCRDIVYIPTYSIHIVYCEFWATLPISIRGTDNKLEGGGEMTCEWLSYSFAALAAPCRLC